MTWEEADFHGMVGSEARLQRFEKEKEFFRG